MLPALSLRVSWICLLLFSSVVCFPAIDDYQYPYTDASSDDSPDQQSVEEPAPEYTTDMSEDDGFSPRSGAQQAGSQAENQAPAASPAANWATYQPNNYGVSATSRPASAPQSSVAELSYAPQSQAGPSVAYSPGFAAAPSHTGSVSYRAPAASHGGFGGYTAPAASHGGFGGYRAPAASHGGFGGYGVPAGSHGGSGYAAAPEGPSSAGTLVYSGAPSFSFQGSSFGNEYAPLPRVGFESFNPNGWMPSRSFPDFTVWGAQEVANVGSKGGKGVKGAQDEEEEVETFSVPASSYIVQTRNGYQRAREVSSHMNYSPELPEPAVIYYEVKQKVAPQAEPVKGGKGGKQ